MLMTADNKQIAINFKPSKTMAKEFTMPLPQLIKGSYTLSWKSVAKDLERLSRRRFDRFLDRSEAFFTASRRANSSPEWLTGSGDT